MYMSRKAIRTAAVDKINSALDWQCETIEDIKFNIRNVQIAKKVSDAIDSLKVCDPAVGSGHFLVSILNEIIALKSDLNVLFDVEGNHIGNLIQCYVINDELVIQDMSGNNFVYQTGNQQSEQVQKAIFSQKRHILENSLFAVDINPSSVNICRLRLWIELLKSSYYYQDTDTDQPVLTTLPNIDINIKVGDSLLHKFDFDYEFDMRKTDFKDYLSLVKDYKDTNNKRIKAEIWKKIENLKRSFDDTASSPELKKLSRLLSERNKAGAISLFEEENKNSKEVAELNKQLAKAEKELEYRLKNPLFAKGMEWRMEFPEILGEAGEFIGFDLVIGNPPYIFAQNNVFSDEMKNYYSRNYPLNNYQANTFGLFLELAFSLVRDGGGISYIIPNSFLTINQYKTLRHHILKNYDEVTFINSKDKIFDEASIDVCILDMYTKRPSKVILGVISGGETNIVDETKAENLLSQDVITISSISEGVSSLLLKIEKNSKILEKNYGTVKDGLKAYERGKGSPKQPEDKDEFNDFKAGKPFFSNKKNDDSYRKFLSGSDLQRYRLKWSGKFLSYGNHLAAPRDSKLFEGERLLIARIPVKSVYTFRATYTKENFVHEQSIESITNLKVSPLYLIGVLNSKILSFYAIEKFDFLQRNTFPQMRLTQIKQFPIPNSNVEQQNEIADLVKKIMEEMAKEKVKQDLVDSLNIKIDDLVMDLFGLTEEEKQTVRDFEV